MDTATKWIIGIVLTVFALATGWYFLIHKAASGDGLKAGSTGADVSSFQEDLGSLGNGIEVSGTWDAQTTAAYNAQCKTWGVKATQPIRLSDWQNLMLTKAASS